VAAVTPRLEWAWQPASILLEEGILMRSRRFPTALASIPAALVVLLASASASAGASAAGSVAAADPTALRGPEAVTPAGWRVAPAGREFGISKLASGFQGPLGSALSPDGTHLLTASSGAARIDSVDLFDLAAGTRTATVPYDAVAAGGPAVFYGVVFSPDGRRAWASGGGQNSVHAYAVNGGQFVEVGQIPTPFFPAGLAYATTPRGDRIYVANNLSAPASASAGNPPGHEVTVIDPSGPGRVEATIDLGVPLAPLGVAFSRDGRTAYVTNWLGRSVSVIDTATEQKTGDVELSPLSDPMTADHPSAIAANPATDEVYTANANTDTVSVIDGRTGTLSATIDVSLVPGPKGAIPDGLSVSPDGRRLYVAEAGENAVAVVDLVHRRAIGFIPTGWYPADVKATPDGRAIVVTNTNDSGAGPNPCGKLTPRTDCPAPDPNRDAPGRLDHQYSGSMIKGSVQVIDLPGGHGLGGGQLRRLTRQVRANNQADRRGQPKPAALSAIKHVIYVVKENRTYDQVLGDLGKGNGDPSLTLFKDDTAPNQRELARRFATIDNFYADAEVSADGHNWITTANAADYVDKTWPINYSPQPRSAERAYDFEDLPFSQQLLSEPLAGDPTIPRSGAAPTAGYLWDDAYNQHVSYRDYGEYTGFPGSSPPGLPVLPGCPAGANVSHTTHLADRFGSPVDTAFAGYNLACSDHTQREPEWAREFAGFAASGTLPALSIVRLPNDHTMGTRPGAATPQSYVADNDLALGRLVDTVSHSRYWKDTVILVTEDDAQNGPDHVDAHRTLALAISPYTQTGRVDSTHYDTSSMVATIEGLLGLPPMSITDARVNPMWPSFTSQPTLTPYDARNPTVVPFGDPGAPVNSTGAPLAAAATHWPLTGQADAAPEGALNAAIWKSVKGAASRMPGPRHTIIGELPNASEAGH